MFGNSKMKYMKPFGQNLKHGVTVKTAVKKIIPKIVYTKIRKSLNRNTPMRLYFENNTASIDLENRSIHGLTPVFYWDGTPNFGDLIGPYLISKITGKPVLNIINLQYSGIMSVGSILNMINRKGMVIWGSGLMQELTNERIMNLKKCNPKILSLRGRNTAKQLLEAGISVPDQSFYGDPALILPSFYSPSISFPKDIGVCPHFTHKSYFLNYTTDKDNINIIDVQNDVETVIDSICSSTVCISTSLHGLIIAQAYGIPWIWLEIIDDNLDGKDFKFKDFFSTLDEAQVSHMRVNLEDIKNLNYKKVAQNATLPNGLYDEKLILEALEKYLHGIKSH